MPSPLRFSISTELNAGKQGDAAGLHPTADTRGDVRDVAFSAR